MNGLQHPIASRARAALAAVAVWLLAGGAAAQPAGDPPARVARVAETRGQVWLYRPDAGEWISAVRNQPVTEGDRLATDEAARVELQVGSTTLRLDGATEVEVAALDDAHLALQLERGSVAARVRDVDGAGEFELETDDGRFVVDRPGSYRFDRDDRGSAATVASGLARYEGPNSALPIGAGEHVEFWIDAGGVAQYRRSEPIRDAFAAWVGELDRREAGASLRYVSPEMTGVEDLDRYGRWEQSADYGAIWIPTVVVAGWVPYSHGHWTWIAPWGWTWIDDAPWGFAPFHYGRWVYLRERWCWTPGERVRRPVYAPALVGWIAAPRGGPAGAIRSGPAVGWFPLAPREVYVPSYPVSPRYVRDLNIAQVRSVARIDAVLENPRRPREFENRRVPRAVTVVPASVLEQRRPVAPAADSLRRAPWVRELAQRPDRATALIAPPVAAPVAPRRDTGAGAPPSRRDRPAPPLRTAEPPSPTARPEATHGARPQPVPSSTGTGGLRGARPEPPAAMRPEAPSPNRFDAARDARPERPPRPAPPERIRTPAAPPAGVTSAEPQRRRDAPAEARRGRDADAAARPGPPLAPGLSGAPIERRDPGGVPRDRAMRAGPDEAPARGAGPNAPQPAAQPPAHPVQPPAPARPTITHVPPPAAPPPPPTMRSLPVRRGDERAAEVRPERAGPPHPAARVGVPAAPAPVAPRAAELPRPAPAAVAPPPVRRAEPPRAPAAHPRGDGAAPDAPPDARGPRGPREPQR